MKKKLSTLLLLIFVISPTAIYAFVPPLSDFEFGIFEDKEIWQQNTFYDFENFTLKSDLQSRTLIPSYYRVQIKPIFDPIEDPAERFTAPGSVSIWVDCVEPTNTIVLNTKEIEVDEKSVQVISREDFRSISVLSRFANPNETTYTIGVGETLQAKHGYEIRLNFISRVFLDRMDGLYLSNYTDPSNNETKFLVVTQMEPYGTRQLFPCFDIPDMKAIFDFSIGRRGKYNSLSNMEIFKTEAIKNAPGWYWDHYNSTVKMPTYLIAVIVSEFTSETADSAIFGGKPVKIWGPKHKIDRGGGLFAAKTAAALLQFYEDYFLAEYPLPKMDSAEIPHFSAGAMENYGLNTYREDYLLFYPESTESTRFRISTVIAHELGHQWFGDLVTTKTWPHIWLNEGFASYVEVLGSDAVCPEFEYKNQFVAITFQNALEYDQSPASHPIVEETFEHARFDRITYKKGASLIRMMKGFLGEATLRKALQNYLKKYTFGNAYQSDLFAILDETVAKEGTFSNFTSVREIMESWTLQKGYPLIRVLLADSNRIYISQERFVEGNSNKYMVKRELGQGNELWWVPVNLATKRNPTIRTGQADFWIPNSIGTLLKSNIDTSDWLVLNPDAVGYYRVLYDEVLRKRIITQLESDHEVLRPNKRSQIIDDYFNFAWSDYVTIDKSLGLTTYLAKETDLNVWTTTLRHLLKTYNLFSRTPGFDSFRNYILPRISAALTTIGIENKPDEKGISVLLRTRLFEWACSLEDSKCLQYSANAFQKWIDASDENPIPKEVYATIYCSAVAILGQSAWDVTFEKYKAESQSIRKNVLFKALACSKDVSNLNRLLDLSLDSSSGIEKAYVTRMFQNVLSNSVGREIALNFLKVRFTDISAYLESSTKALDAALDIFPLYFHSEEDLIWLQNLVDVEAALLQPLGKKINTTLATIRQNKAWMTKFYEPMKLWFERENRLGLRTNIYSIS